MTYEMTLRERELKKVEEISLNLIKMGVSFEVINKATKLPMKRIHELSTKLSEK